MIRKRSFYPVDADCPSQGHKRICYGAIADTGDGGGGLERAFRPPSPQSTRSSDRRVVARARPVEEVPPAPPSTISCPLLRTRSLPDLQELRRLPPVLRPTRENLQVMDPFQTPITPTASSRSERSSRYSRTSPSKSTSAASSVGDDGAKLELINILDDIKGKAQFEKMPLFRQAVLDTVGGERASAMKTRSVERFAQAHNKLRTSSESKVAALMMPFLIKNERTTSSDCADGEGRHFEEDHWGYNQDMSFGKNTVPLPLNLRLPSDHEAKYGIKTPKPDFVYGLSPSAFSIYERRLFSVYDACLTANLHAPFLVLEWKGSKGIIEEARTQARRDGAAMVYARRRARKKAVEGGLCVKLVDGVDMDTVTFSAVMTPDIVFVFVHWALDSEGVTVWYMALAKRFFFDDESVSDIRAALHNIVDWGLESRLLALKAESKAYEVLEARATPPLSESSGKRKRVDSA